MIKAEKKQLVKALVDEFGKSENFYFVDFTGISAEDVTHLRKELRAENACMKVIKNRLLSRILEQLDVSIPESDIFKGSTAVLYSLDDILVPARKISQYAEDNIPVKFKGAFIEGRFLDSQEVERLAKIPPRDTLLAQLVGLFNGIKSALVSVLAAKSQELVLVLSSLREQKEEE